ncbi:receptor like protein 14 [Forsythia ovata]|uniref:Receptor like protein 14 n=1 Tax=Forsythia ovata TaxID=205694 RepID=A0ABD1P7M2_9LAMI
MVLSFLNRKWYCLGCFEEERISLLYLKENINFPNGISLPSWVEYETKAGCCHWEGVQCSNTTGRVIQLDLYDIRYWTLEDWYFNASLFLPFQELRNLSLGYNNLVGWIENEGFDKLSKLKSLEALDLRENSFDCNILSSLSQLSSLKHLNLQEIFGQRNTYSHERLLGLKKLQVLDFSGNHGIKDIDVLSVLELYALNDLVELDLSKNEIEKFNTSKDTKTMHSLQVLYLDGIIVSNISNMLQSLRAFPYLKNLYLRYMKIPIATIYELRHLSKLEGLFLDNSHLDANFLQSIGVMTSLKFLSLSSCGLGGTLLDHGCYCGLDI